MDRNFLQCYYIGHSPSQTKTEITAVSQIIKIIPRGGSVSSLVNRYVDMYFDVVKSAYNTDYGTIMI